MCRIFGFRSILQSGVHHSLINADNAMAQQSDHHPDGWGVAFYKMNSPHLIKMNGQARYSQIFKKVSGVVSSNTVLAHSRKSTIGESNPLNTHPFQFGHWVFAHNGNIKNFNIVREQLLSKIDNDFIPFIFGDTDSEVLFYFLLTLLKKKRFLNDAKLNETVIKLLITEYIDEIQRIVGPLTESRGDYSENYLTFLLTDGDFLIGFNGGQNLLYSTHKKNCPEKTTCEYFQPICESPAKNGDEIHHLLVSSEVIQNENIWNKVAFKEYVGVSKNLKFFKGQIP